MRPRSVLFLVLLVGLAGLPRYVAAQATGEFLCSAGSKDGQACQSDDDCPGGVCVIGQGVCDGGADDGFPCDCAKGTCLSQPVCTSDATLGTCSGGVNATECCDVTTNCTGGVSCTGTQKICLGGDDKAFSCLRDAQCPGSVCRSTGKFCSGGDFDGFSCVDDADCPSGTCETAVATDTPTRTPTRTPSRLVTASPTPSRAPTSVLPTPTGSPPATSTPSAIQPTVPGATRTPTPAVATAPPTLNPGMGILKEPVQAGSTVLVVEDASSFPDTGFVKIGNDPAIGYSKTGNVLALSSPVKSSFPSGQMITVSNRLIIGAVGEGGGCAIGVGPGNDGLALLVAVGLAASAVRRRRRR